MSQSESHTSSMQFAQPQQVPAAPPPPAPQACGVVPESLRRCAGPVLIALALLAIVLWTWQLWPDPIIDFGREAYVPWQLSQGQVLYRDIAYFNGPLSPYLNSVWVRLLGVHLGTLALANLLVLTAVLALMYDLVRTFADRLSATVGCLLFVLLLAGVRYDPVGNFNWICPYSHELTHGIALALAAVYALVRYRRTPRALWMATAGLATGLALLTKVEVAAAALMTSVVGAALLLWLQDSGRRGRAMAAGLFAAGLVVPTAVAFALLWRHMPAGQALSRMFGAWAWALNPDIASLRYYRWCLGLLFLRDNLLEIARWMLMGAVGVLVAGGAALLTRWRRPAWQALAAGLTFAGVLAGVWLCWQKVPWRGAPSVLPVVMIVMVAVCGGMLWRARRQGPAAAARWVGPLALSLLALLLLAKIFLHVRYYHYGYGLAMPATLLGVAVLLTWLPAWIRRRGGSAAVFQAAFLAVFVVAVYVHLGIASVTQGEANAGFSTPAGTIYTDKLMADAASDILGTLEQMAAPGQTLAVLPEGVMFNFLVQRPNPTPYLNYLPPEMIMFGEEAMVEAMKQHPPDFVILVHRHTEEYGLRFFGQDYGRRLYSWVARNYTIVKRHGAMPLRGSRFGMLLLRYGRPATTTTAATATPARPVGAH